MIHVLVVKGDRLIAQRELDKRGMKPLNGFSYLSHVNHTVTHVEGASAYTLGAWFTASPGPAPFPEGALLWYGEKSGGAEEAE